MENAKGVIKSLMTSLATAMVDGEPREWPPKCPFVLYQPVRPYDAVRVEEHKKPK